MTPPSQDTARIDPYENFKFKVKWDGKYVAGVGKVAALTRSIQVVKHREGGDPPSQHKSPGQTDYGPITLERGVTHDVEFEQWANKVWDYESSAPLGQEVSLKDFRKDVVIEMHNETGRKVMAYNVYSCWVSEWTAQPDLDGRSNAVVIQSMTLQNEGWERVEVVPPTEPGFVIPSS